MEILSFPEASTPPKLRAQVRALHDEAWPAPPDVTAPTGGSTHDPALHPVSMLLVDDDRVLAALDLLHLTLTHGGESYRAAGLSTVVTRRDVRGHGHGKTLVSAARVAMAEADVDLGLFTCDRMLAPFYASAGWQLLQDTVLIGGTPDSPFPSDQPGFDKVTLAAFFTSKADRHQGDFEAARIELYPGLIDKLW